MKLNFKLQIAILTLITIGIIVFSEFMYSERFNFLYYISVLLVGINVGYITNDLVRWRVALLAKSNQPNKPRLKLATINDGVGVINTEQLASEITHEDLYKRLVESYNGIKPIIDEIQFEYSFDNVETESKIFYLSDSIKIRFTNYTTLCKDLTFIEREIDQFEEDCVKLKNMFNSLS